MTRRDFLTKWLAYALALLPVWWLESFVCSRFTVWGVHPMLLPLAAVAVAVLEGGTAGAGFGLAAGILWDAMTPGVPGFSVVLMACIGLGAGLLAQYALRQDLLGCFLCSLAALAVIDGARVGLRLLWRTAPAAELFSLAGREIAWSLCFVPLVYLLFRWVFRRVPKATVI